MLSNLNYDANYEPAWLPLRLDWFRFPLACQCSRGGIAFLLQRCLVSTPSLLLFFDASQSLLSSTFFGWSVGDTNVPNLTVTTQRERKQNGNHSNPAAISANTVGMSATVNLLPSLPSAVPIATLHADHF